MENTIKSLLELGACPNIVGTLIAPEYLKKSDIKSSIEGYHQIEQAAYLDIPVDHCSPIFKAFAYRQQLAHEILKIDDSKENELEALKLQFEYLNNDIRKYLGL